MASSNNSNIISPRNPLIAPESSLTIAEVSTLVDRFIMLHGPCDIRPILGISKLLTRFSVICENNLHSFWLTLLDRSVVTLNTSAHFMRTSLASRLMKKCVSGIVAITISVNSPTTLAKLRQEAGSIINASAIMNRLSAAEKVRCSDILLSLSTAWLSYNQLSVRPETKVDANAFMVTAVGVLSESDKVVANWFRLLLLHGMDDSKKTSMEEETVTLITRVTVNNAEEALSAISEATSNVNVLFISQAASDREIMDEFLSFNEDNMEAEPSSEP
jgi:hypothetical protein